ncbi:hypothetical protein BN3590_02011 [Clostridium sp. C105KSO15]|nr:hypothetical protein BN3590_02011 [Clostridium sp. C105KSO15]
MEKEQFLYKKIYLDLKNKILAGELEEGTCLPVSYTHLTLPTIYSV